MAYVMIVDDDEEFAAAAAIILRGQGHEVATQSDTAAAMTAMQSRTPDVMILDVMFPEDNFAGFELARAMCKHRDLSRIPILMLTGVNEKLGTRLSALDADTSFLPVTDFLEKPVDLDALVSKTRDLLQAVAREETCAG
jgi:two-component system alkaline phosphatase synthesis response regulator PhoP